MTTAGGAVRALVVDDEPALAELVTMGLRYEGWETCSAADGATALDLAARFRPDVVVLDVLLPDMDGLEVLRRLRSRTPRIPVLFLTARDAEEDRARGVHAGADDYMTKPFGLSELIARLQILVRAAAAPHTRGAPAALVTVGDLTLDDRTGDVRRAGEPVALTATEFTLLRHLMLNPRRLVPDAEILDRVLDAGFAGSTAFVGLCIGSLRTKIDRGHPPMIHTVRGAGHLLSDA